MLQLTFCAAVLMWGLWLIRSHPVDLLALVLWGAAFTWLIFHRWSPGWKPRARPAAAELPLAEPWLRTIAGAAAPAAVFAPFVLVGEVITDPLVIAFGAGSVVPLLAWTLHVLRRVLASERRTQPGNVRLWYGVYSYNPFRKVSSYYIPVARDTRPRR